MTIVARKTRRTAGNQPPPIEEFEIIEHFVSVTPAQMATDRAVVELLPMARRHAEEQRAKARAIA